MIIKFLSCSIKRGYVLFYVLILVFSFQSVFSQDIYNQKNSKKYADYLMLSNQYNLAAEEYERLVFLDPENKEFKIKLLQAYRKSGKLDVAINRVYGLTDNVYNLPRGLSVEYLSSLIFADSIKKIDMFLNKNATLNPKDVSIFRCSSLLLDKKYKKSEEICLNGDNSIEVPDKLKQITKAALARKMKSPVLAASLSTVIPGLGKVYTKNYVDGIMSLIFVAGSAWQSYKGFKNKGTKSVSGWIFGGISLGFYIGNIYGSAKAAKGYNKIKYNETDSEVYDFIRHYSF